MNADRKKPLLTHVGDRAFRLQFADASWQELDGWKRAIEEQSPGAACVVGRSSLLVVGLTPEQLPVAPATRRSSPRRLSLEVSFASDDAPDLDELLSASNATREAFLSDVGSWRLCAEMVGFLPGFAYLHGVPERWRWPRRTAPRPRVPAGSFAVANDVAGFYPGESPGGWNLIGRTGVLLWDPAAERPNLIDLGDQIEIVPVDRSLPAGMPVTPRMADRPVAVVEEPGQLLLLVPPARVERLRHGLAAGGPFDDRASTAADRAAGNVSPSCQLEAALVAPRLRFFSRCVVAWSGARVKARLGVSEVSGFVVEVAAGDVLTFGPLSGGARLNIAIRGGFENLQPRWATEPQRLVSGALLGCAELETCSPRLTAYTSADVSRIGVVAGPDEVPADVMRAMEACEWFVSDCSRRGVRLTSRQPLPPASATIESAPLLSGSVQWHPDGSLTILGVDHPITGGYPQPATVCGDQLWKLAQLRAGDVVRLERISRPNCHRREVSRPGAGDQPAFR